MSRSHLAFALSALALVTACPSSKKRADPPPPAKVGATSDTVVGSLGGDFSVSANGDATYEVEVSEPMGIQRVHPNLTLSYSSLADNGLLGVGWSLQGLSAITRCKRIPDVDGERGTVTYTASDVYCLDGQRLINVSGAYGSGGSIYRTELETWRRIVASTELCGSGPCSFTVTTKKGETWRYGGAADSRILAVGRKDVRVWAVDRVRDLNGNTIALSYTQAPISSTSAADGEFYPLRIDYTANDVAKVEANRSVRFRWIARADVTSKYLGGAPVITRAILDGIATYVGETVTSDYRLVYETGASTGRSRLKSLQLCGGADATAPCYTPTRLDWQDAAKLTYVGADTTLRLPTTSDRITPGDVNGDGRGDVIQVSDAQPRVATAYVATGEDYAACPKTANIPSTGNPLDDLIATDADGNGRTDLVLVWNDAGKLKVTTYLATASGACGFSAGVTSTTGQSGAFDALYPMDVNGDGRTDVVTGQVSGNTMTLSTFLAGASYTFAGSSTMTFGGSAKDSPPYGIWAAEVNGDGMLDLVASWSDRGALALSSYLSDGKTFGGAISTTLGSGAGELRVWPLDVNGDGLGDLVEAWTSSKGVLMLTAVLAAGDGTFVDGGDTDTKRSGTDFAAFWPMDVNGDGRTDVVQGWDDGGKLSLVVYRNTGLGFDGGTVTGTSMASVDVKTTFPLDFDGDAHVDLVQGWPDGGALHFTNFVVQGAQPDLASLITDGWNGEIALSYVPLSDPDVYQTGVVIPPTDCATNGATATAYPMSDAFSYTYVLAPAQAPFQVVGGGTMYVVDRSTRRGAKGTESVYSYTDSYRYANALIDRGGRGWLGFGRVSILDESLGLRTVSDYYQGYPLTGTLARVEYECDGKYAADPNCPETAADTLIRASTTCYDPVVTATGATSPNPTVMDVRKVEVQFDEFSYGTYESSRATTYAYDAYGNTTLQTYLGAVSREGKNLSPADDVYTCNRYENDEPAWRLEFLDARKVSSTSACTDFGAFDDDLDFALTTIAYSTDGRMSPLEKKSWDSSLGQFVTSSYTYDTFGNVLSETDPGGQTTNITFETTYNTYPEKKTYPDAGHGRFSEILAFDPRFGSLAGRSDFNGVVAITCLDDFGRPLALQGTPGAGSASDANCATPLLTGSGAGGLRAATVVTTEAHDWTREGGAIYHTQNVLQSWTTSGPPDFRSRRLYIDGLDRNYKVITQDAGDDVLTCRAYQSDDAVVAESIPTFTTTTDATCAPGAAGGAPLWSKTTYDVYGRLLEQNTPSGPKGEEVMVTTYAYAGDDRTTVTYASTSAVAYAKVFEYAYFNDQRKTVSVTVPGDGNARTTYAYDRIGRLTSVTDPATTANPKGVANRIAYDSLNRQQTVDNPDQNTVGGTAVAARYVYDVDGDTVTTTDAKGQKTTFTYDGGERPLTVTAADGSVIAYTYDGKSATYGLGRVTHVDGKDQDGKTTFTYDFSYDAYGHQSSIAITIAGDPRSYTTQRAYDPLGRVRTITFPDGTQQTRAYAFGNLTELAMGGETYATFSGYTPLDNPTTISYGNDAVAALRYAPQGNLLGQTVTDAKGEKLLEQAINWDDLMLVASIDDTLRRGGTDLGQVFGYTSKRLTRARADGTYGDKTFAYDASGNLTSNDGVTYAYEAHRVVKGTSGGKTVFSAGYDANGNLTGKTAGGVEWGFDYDARNRLVGVRRDGAEAMDGLIYDQEGRRLYKRESTGVETFYVDPLYVVTRLPGDVVLATRSVLGGNGSIATVTDVVSGVYSGPTGGGVPQPGTVYFHPDYLGSTSLTTDDEGAFATQLVYEPYGGVFTTTGPDDFRPKFQGKEADETSQLYYFDARYYDPSLGRFLSPDGQLGDQLYEADALNRFAFASNNPVTYTDPSGHNIIQSIIGALIGGLEIVIGVAIDVLSAGALEPLGGAFIGAGLNGVQYSAFNSGSFSWKQYAIQQGIGAVLGVMTGGFGGEAEAGVAGISEASELELSESVAAQTESRASAALAASEGDALESATKGAIEEGATGGGSDSIGAAVGESVCSVPNSFGAGTLVMTPDGDVPIERIAVGDLVLARDERTGAVGARPVTQVFVRLADEVIELELSTHDGERDVLRTTPPHPFWARGLGWVAAGQLLPGDEVFLADGRWAMVDLAVVSDEQAWVYNLAVEELHTYFVGELGEWVHNCGNFLIFLRNAPFRLVSRRVAVIGETQWRVVANAGNLGARQILEDWPRTLPVIGWLGEAELAKPLAWNAKWIEELMKQNYVFYDIELDLLRTTGRSPFYKVEIDALTKNLGYTLRTDLTHLIGETRNVATGGRVWLPPNLH